MFLDDRIFTKDGGHDCTRLRARTCRTEQWSHVLQNKEVISHDADFLEYEAVINIPSEHGVQSAAKLQAGLPPSPHSVESYVVNRACCQAWQTTAGERRQKREGMRRQRSRVVGGGGLSATAAGALKQDKSSGGTPPPSSQMNISACLLPRLLHLRLFSFFHPLHYSVACSQSRAHSSSCRSSRSAERRPPASTFPPSSPGHGESKLALRCC